MSHTTRWFRAAAAFVIAGLLDASAHAVPIYGGPTYDSVVDTGYDFPTLPFAPGRTVSATTGVGYARRYEAGDNMGDRAVRWGTSGVMELGHLGTNSSGFTKTLAYAINVAGTAVGNSNKYEGDEDRGTRAVRWDVSGTATELDNLGGADLNDRTQNLAYAINTAGTAVGFGQKYDGDDRWLGDRALRWGAGGTAVTELGTFSLRLDDGYAFNRAYAINDGGTVVGYGTQYALGFNKGNRALRWNAAGSVQELGNLGTDNDAFTENRAVAVNASGTTVGYGRKYESGTNAGDRAIRWAAADPAAQELDTLGVNSSGYALNRAYAINAAGTAVGYGDKYDDLGADKGTRAIRWDATGAATELGNLGTDTSGDTNGQAYDINDAGVAVGYVDEFDDVGTYLGTLAVAWGTDGVALDLNTQLDAGSSWVNLTEARHISDTGWITGLGEFDPDGPGGLAAYTRMFLMQVIQVPEPGCSSLPALGALALLRRSRRAAIRR